jgi:capsular polysaccharide transport system ATP-binding protein
MTITVRNLSKSFPLRGTRHYILKNASFQIPAGRSVALFGPNGAGKSTLLRMLGGTEVRDAGSIEITGSISWPVGLAGGFHNALTARDNCRFVMQVHGMREPQLSEKLEEIKAFSGIGKFFEMPVQTFSSGMRSRVAFALSVSMPFDYYLIDEITAVGDAQFRDKSKEALLAKKKDAAFIIATHNLQEAIDLADCALLLHNEQVHFYEDVSKAADAYRLIAFPDSLYAQKLRASGEHEQISEATLS